MLGVWLDLHRDGRQTLAAQLQMESMMAQVDEDVSRYLVPTPFIDCDSQQIVEYAHSVTRRTGSPVDNAISLYHAVRDDIRYDPYHVRLDLAHLKASYTLQVRRGYCVSKAVLLAAASRAVGIPSRLGVCRCQEPPNVRIPEDDYGNRPFRLPWLHRIVPE